ncbi:MAG TPA: NADH-quinone oxidoreductase subunit L [Verrucomicrobiae bacterium]|nr:NADH-quinone oxidoreductase subunit L [Verrucomicrobiae bacterium]
MHASFQWAWLIPAMPLLSFLIIAFVTKKWPKLSSTISIICILTAFVLALWIGYGVLTTGDSLVEKPYQNTVDWLNFNNVKLGLTDGPLKIEFGMLIDPLTAMMLFVVTLVASMVQIYSVGYMHGDKGYSRYFAYQSLFAMSMLGMVIATNLLQLFIFWELVGLCSYLLIGFWFFKVSAREAAKKAFITTRVGDFGLLLGILFLFNKFGTLNLHQLSEMMTPEVISAVTIGGVSYLGLTAFLVFIGPIGKSGQFPLHVWLPDAMEGPTPVSALIHAATMVVAGVFLVARMFFLFKAAPPAAMEFVAYLGGFTALFAATIAVAQNDIKRILAYSTLSQLGYMMMALGLGAMTASMFHLMTHAFFKALMFLGAGSVIHALHEKQDIWEMGGLWKKMKITGTTFFIGVLAISGVPGLSGFFSKDEILAAAYHHNMLLYIAASFTAFLTAFYMSRLFFVAFTGPEKPENHPHESPWVMTVPLLILAFFSVVGGWVALPEHGFGYYVRPWGTEFEHESMNYLVAGISTILGLGGIFLAWATYNRQWISAEKVATTFRPVYTLLKNKYYVDELYLWIVKNIVDGVAKVLHWFDIYVVDGVVNGLAFIARFLGSVFRRAQSGQLQTYAIVFFFAIVVLFLVITIGEGQLSALNLSLLGGK